MTRTERTRLALHWKILIGMALGLGVGLAVNVFWTPGVWESMGVEDAGAYLKGEAADGAGIAAWCARFAHDLNSFVGDLFIRLLRFIAVPIVLFSLIVGTASLNDLKKLSRIGGKAIAIYISTTAVAITIGLMLANLVKPGGGRFLSEATRELIAADNVAAAASKVEQALSSKPTLWDTILNVVPNNPFAALAQTEMLQIVFFALAIGIGLTLIPRDKAAPVVRLADGMTDVIIKLVHLIMLAAPYAVFALIAGVISELGLEVLRALVAYSVVVIVGLMTMIFVVYPMVLRVFTKVGYRRFFRAIAPAQLLAFSSSSSSATLPITLECVEERLGVSEEVASFVVPVGSTVNMDGTALYQGVATVFIAQMVGIDLSIGQQLTIVLTATLASIGTAGVPGVGLLMLVIVLQSVGLDEYMTIGIAVILGVDRILDMCRTTCNVTGDCMVAAVVASSEGAMLTEDQVVQMRAATREAGVDEHAHEGTGAEYGTKLGSTSRPVDVSDQD